MPSAVTRLRKSSRTIAMRSEPMRSIVASACRASAPPTPPMSWYACRVSSPVSRSRFSHSLAAAKASSGSAPRSPSTSASISSTSASSSKR